MTKKQEKVQADIMSRMLGDVPQGKWSGVCPIPAIGAGAACVVFGIEIYANSEQYAAWLKSKEAN